MKISELEKKLKEIELPKEFQLNESTKITDVERFVNGHLTILKSNKHKTFIPYYNRLIKFYKQVK